MLKVNLKPGQEVSKTKIKNLFVSCTRPTVRKRCYSKYFFCVICDDFFFVFFLLPEIWPEVPICSRNYFRNWFTLLNEQNLLLDFEGTRFVNERSLFWKKKKSPYLPTHWWNGGSGVGNEHIFKAGLTYHTGSKEPSSVGQVQNRHHHLIKCNIFSRWYSWRIAHMALNNNYSLTHWKDVGFYGYSDVLPPNKAWQPLFNEA